MKTSHNNKTQNGLGATVLVILLISISPFLVAQELPENDPHAEYGIVYFIRGKEMMGSAEGFKTFIDDQSVCRLKNRHYTAHRLSPGEHTFKAQYGGKKAKRKAEVVLIDVEAGGTYYINLVVHTNFWWPDVTPREITRNSAMRLFKDDDIRLDPNCGNGELVFQFGSVIIMFDNDFGISGKELTVFVHQSLGKDAERSNLIWRAQSIRKSLKT